MKIKLIKYGIVGVGGTFIHIGILTLFVEYFLCDPVISSTIGFIATVIFSYYLNYNWTFKSNKKHSVAFPRYALVSLSGLLLNTLIMFISVNVMFLWYGIGQLIAIILIPISNFTFNFYWSFRGKNNI